jgi:hypothetical protein
MGGREPTKTILIARRARKRIGEIKRIFLIFRRDFLSSRNFQKIL